MRLTRLLENMASKNKPNRQKIRRKNKRNILFGLNSIQVEVTQNWHICVYINTQNINGFVRVEKMKRKSIFRLYTFTHSAPYVRTD